MSDGHLGDWLLNGLVALACALAAAFAPYELPYLAIGVFLAYCLYRLSARVEGPRARRAATVLGLVFLAASALPAASAFVVANGPRHVTKLVRHAVEEFLASAAPRQGSGALRATLPPPARVQGTFLLVTHGGDTSAANSTAILAPVDSIVVARLSAWDGQVRGLVQTSLALEGAFAGIIWFLVAFFFPHYQAATLADEPPVTPAGPPDSAKPRGRRSGSTEKPRGRRSGERPKSG